MSGIPQHHELSKGRELSTLIALAAVQFTHIMDFMILMPLGAHSSARLPVTRIAFRRLFRPDGNLRRAVAGRGAACFTLGKATRDS